MQRLVSSSVWALAVVSVSLLSACGDSAGDGGQAAGTGGSGAGMGATGGAVSGAAGAGAGSGGAATGGTAPGTGGTSSGAGGSGAGSGGTSAGSGGLGGRSGSSGSSPGGSAGACPAGSFPTADPAATGPFEITTEDDVGPDGAFTLFRPASLGESGLCHPVITWGNGTGTTPSIYARLLNHLASHGFVVIASNSMNVATGEPPPMLQGVSWVLEQSALTSSPLYGHIDTAHIGATGHSQGAFATMTAGADERVTTIAPIEGAQASRNLHGPALLLCGGMDTTLPCSGTTTAFNGITNQPVMMANQLAATHTNWIGFGAGGTLNPFIVAVTGWMRVQLMGDTALRSMFYGATCTLCEDTTTWAVMQKMLD